MKSITTRLLEAIQSTDEPPAQADDAPEYNAEEHVGRCYTVPLPLRHIYRLMGELETEHGQAMSAYRAVKGDGGEEETSTRASVHVAKENFDAMQHLLAAASADVCSLDPEKTSRAMICRDWTMVVEEKHRSEYEGESSSEVLAGTDSADNILERISAALQSSDEPPAQAADAPEYNADDYGEPREVPMHLRHLYNLLDELETEHGQEVKAYRAVEGDGSEEEAAARVAVFAKKQHYGSTHDLLFAELNEICLPDPEKVGGPHVFKDWEMAVKPMTQEMEIQRALQAMFGGRVLV